jgi:DNA-binding beta-propeller fold protein YncE
MLDFAGSYVPGTGGQGGATPPATGGAGGAGGAIDAMSGGGSGGMISAGGASGVGGGGGVGGVGGVGGIGGMPPVGDGSIDHVDAAIGEAPQRAVTADFLAKTLSIVDVDLLREGGSRADALIGTVDLGMYSPGPLSLAITPDGKTALVSISAGFLGAFITVPPGDGILLFVDIETRAVTGELEVGGSPMGIAITPDGKRAFVGLYSENYFAVVDIEAKTFDTVATGSGYNEELSIDDTGTVGILTYGPAGNAKTFSIADPAGVLGQTVGLSGDAAGVAFFPGTKIAYLMQAPTILTGNVGGHDLVDVSNPAAPMVIAGPRTGSHPTTYPMTSIAARGSVAFTSTEDGMVSVVEMALSGQAAMEKKRVVVGAAESLAYGLAATRDGRVLIAVPGEHNVGVVDLEAGSAFMVPWQITMTGPTEIKLVP